MSKSCFTCGLEKDVDLFPRNKRKPDGYDYQCKDCVNARIRAKYAINPQAKIAATRQYHLDHPEWSRARLRASHEAHAEARYVRARQRLADDPAAVARARESTRRSEQRRRAIKRGATADLIPADHYAQRLAAFNGCCWICECDLAVHGVCWDHVKPLSRGGEHSLGNLRPACGSCNTRKNDIWPLTPELLTRIKDATMASRLVEGVMP